MVLSWLSTWLHPELTKIWHCWVPLWVSFLIRLHEAGRHNLNVRVASSVGSPDEGTWKKDLCFHWLTSLSRASSHTWLLPHFSSPILETSSGVYHRLKTSSSPGILQLSSARLGLLGHPILWTEKILNFLPLLYLVSMYIYNNIHTHIYIYIIKYIEKNVCIYSVCSSG